MEKFLGVISQIVLLNAAVFCVTVLAAWMVGESLDYKILVLLFLAYFLLQVETAALCFGVSAFISRGSLGIGLGLAALFYFLNIIANLTEKAKFLKYITPFGYAEGADIIADGGIDGRYLAVGMVFAAAGAAAAFYKYVKKDIA